MPFCVSSSNLLRVICTKASSKPKTSEQATYMHHHHPLLQLLLSLLLHAASATFAAAAGGVQCNRRCNNSPPVPYPFGFSGDCPILLNCDATTSTMLLPHSTPAEPYPILSFNTTTSTLFASVTPSCNRTVGNAEKSLTGAGYGISYRTSLFLRGGGACRAPSKDFNCSVQADIMTRVLGTVQCRDEGGRNDTAWTCVAAPPPVTVAAVQGQFLDWKTVAASGCKDALTALVYGDMSLGGVASLEFGVAELGWWVNGTCTAAGRCSPNATCHDVVTPSGAAGHRCKCLDGMPGDGFAAGEGCLRAHDGTAIKGSKKNVPLIVTGVLAGLTAVAAALLLCWLQRRRSAAGRYGSAMRLLSEAATSSGLPVYSYQEVARATNAFSPTHRLGTGAYGTVYVGKLPASAPTLVAIKRLRYRHHDEDEDAAAKQLLNEIRLISSVSHPNLVRLLGCCLDRGEQILVYEYVPNGTLSQHLHGGRLSWRARLGVAAETASAISYLHGTRPPIFHRDVKSSNILLDGELRPKLADFGLSRAVDRLDASRSHVSTAPQGTPGYVDPEYHQNFHLSDKSDVYSFGVVLLELITAKKVVDFDRPASEINLASLGVDRISKGRADEIVDPALVERGEEWVMESVRQVSELAFRCLAFQKDVRPCMTEVAADLARIRAAAPGSDSGFSRLGLTTGLQVDLSVDDDSADSAVKKEPSASPVSVHETWVSDRSSPSTNGSVITPRFR